jgi:hypothetical protein
MIDAFQVIRFSFRDFWDELVGLVSFNLLWSLSAVLPFLPWLLLRGADLGLVLPLSLVLALPLPIVTGGLAYVTNQLSRGKRVGWGVFGTGVRRYWAKSLVVAFINLVALVLIFVNVEFYAVLLEASWTILAVAAWLVVGVYWLLAQMFWFPMILELESEKVFVALRNALAMVIVTPLFSLTCAIAIAIVSVLCIVLTVPAAMALGALLLLIANHATRSRLAFARKEPYEPGVYPQTQKRAR